MARTSKDNLRDWGWTQAKHLLNRAGFGGKPDEIANASEIGFEASLDRLFDFPPMALPEPGWLSEYNRLAVLRFRTMSREERREFMQLNRKRVHELQIGWIKKMVASPTPTEMLWNKMAFFWHGHFATSFQKVKLPPLLFNQVVLFNEHAVGSFRELLHGISRDPAMLRYLDNNQNRKGKPNENFARELMELFSLGPGNYTEHDVKEGARAFTGWSNDPFHFRIRRRQHDYGEKTFLGRSGNFDREDIINIILEQPACAEFITRKILNFLSFENAPEELVHSLAASFRESDYRIDVLLKAIFSESAFYASDVIGTQIKSPVQLVVGTARTLELRTDNEKFFLHMLHMMGQVPYLPPNVKGWPGGRTWIDTSRLLTRYTFAEIVSRGEIPHEVDPRSEADPERGRERRSRGMNDRTMRHPHLGIEFDPRKLFNGEIEAEAIVARLERVLLSVELNEKERAMLSNNFAENRKQMSETDALKALIGDVMTLPTYQLC